MSEPKKRGPKAVTAQHKAAMAVGRNESRAVRLYLEALTANRPKRGRKRTTDSIAKRLAAIEEQLTSAEALTKVNLLQEQANLKSELKSAGDNVDMSELEASFIASVKTYSERKGISYSIWRSMGVDADILSKGGISR
jgi:uncharacterized protein YicC (UPF0701 family)